MTIDQWTKFVGLIALVLGSTLCFGDFIDEELEPYEESKEAGKDDSSAKPTSPVDEGSSSRNPTDVDDASADSGSSSAAPTARGQDQLSEAQRNEASRSEASRNEASRNEASRNEGGQASKSATNTPAPTSPRNSVASSTSDSLPPGPKRTTGARDDAKKPITWQSIGLRGLKESGTVELIDEVLVSQGSLNVTADYAKVFFDNEESEVDKVVAEGNVKMSKVDEGSGERIKAFGDRVYFLNGERKVILEGNARLWRGGNLIQGKKIVYEMETGWVHADRVSGEVRPGEVETAPKP